MSLEHVNQEDCQCPGCKLDREDLELRKENQRILREAFDGLKRTLDPEAVMAKYQAQMPTPEEVEQRRAAARARVQAMERTEIVREVVKCHIAALSKYEYSKLLGNMALKAEYRNEAMAETAIFICRQAETLCIAIGVMWPNISIDAVAESMMGYPAPQVIIPPYPVTPQPNAPAPVVVKQTTVEDE
jgi:hypothetical protein